MCVFFSSFFDIVVLVCNGGVQQFALGIFAKFPILFKHNMVFNAADFLVVVTHLKSWCNKIRCLKNESSRKILAI